MSVQVNGWNHVAIEVDDVAKAVVFYKERFQSRTNERRRGQLAVAGGKFRRIPQLIEALRRNEKSEFEGEKNTLARAIPFILCGKSYTKFTNEGKSLQSLVPIYLYAPSV